MQFAFSGNRHSSLCNCKESARHIERLGLFFFTRGVKGPLRQIKVTVYERPLHCSVLQGFVGSVLDWQGALSDFFSFTAFYEITEPHCAATTVVQYFREGSEKGSGFSGMWHLIDTPSSPPDMHTHTHTNSAWVVQH